MAEPDLILEFTIEKGRSPNLENVGRALLAWNDALQTAVAAIDPSAVLVVELTEVEHGSQRFKQILRRIDDFGKTLDDGVQEYPYIWKHGKALAGCIVGAIIIAGVTVEMTPTPHAPPEEMELLKQIRDELKDDMNLRRSSQSFYGVLQEEPSFSRLQIYEGDTDVPLYSVPRAEFAERSGLFQVGEDQPEIREKQRLATWDVILVKPVLVGKQRRWTFARDGIEFSALMTDKNVLNALHDRTLAIPFAEGVMMQIEVSYRERLEGDVWLPVGDTRKVTKVLSPRVPAGPTPLLASAD